MPRRLKTARESPTLAEIMLSLALPPLAALASGVSSECTTTTTAVEPM